MTKLVIVESPAKVKTISRYLGSGYVVKSCVGHIRDLVKGGGGRQDPMHKMGIDPKSWSAQYGILPGKEKILLQLKEAAKKAEAIYLATDLDREGEAIAWHLQEAIGGDIQRYFRVSFTEITKKAIKEAFEHPSSLNMDRVHAQQARRFLDRVVGYMLSPLLWNKIARGLSAGRVQSVAVRLVSERERAIHAFKPEEYWTVSLTTPHSIPMDLDLVKISGKNFRPEKKEEAQKAVDFLKNSLCQVEQLESKPLQQKPYPPLITSTLQQAASVRLGFGVKRTMMVAQKLYEAGFITYMRTDAVHLSSEAVGQCRDYLKTTWGSDYRSKEPLSYSSGKSAQEAHEAIRPTDVYQTPHSLGHLSLEEQKIYGLIWAYFVACQMTPALYDQTIVTVSSGGIYELKARGKILKFDGYLKVFSMTFGNKKSGEDKVLPPLKVGETFKAKEVTASQHFTKPPPRYTEASLVREMEKRGIGRPSTYASIISTIQERGYVKVEKKRFVSMKMGDIVTDNLLENFQNLMDFGFTADMETRLDSIAKGNTPWKDVLNSFYKDFSQAVQDAQKSMKSNEPTLTHISCELCHRPMQIRVGKTGLFLGCSGYALKKPDQCKSTLNLTPTHDIEAYTEDKDEEEGEESDAGVRELIARKRCNLCDTAMDSSMMDESRKIHICGNYPHCQGYFIEIGQFRVKGYEGPVLTCDRCGDNMQLKTGRFGKYFACSGEDCKNTRKLLKNGEAAPPKMDPIPMPELPCASGGYFVLRDGISGIFLASNLFPKSRETRRPRVSDLLRHKNLLDPKYHAFLKAPSKDPWGKEVQIRFSRQKKEHFLCSEDGKNDKKAGSWILWWNENEQCWKEGREE